MFQVLLVLLVVSAGGLPTHFYRFYPVIPYEYPVTFYKSQIKYLGPINKGSVPKCLQYWSNLKTYRDRVTRFFFKVMND